MQKSKSSHELLYQQQQQNKKILSSNDNQTSSDNHSNHLNNHSNHLNNTNHNFLFVPGQLPNGMHLQLNKDHSNCSSSSSIKMSCSASESSDCSQHSDDNHDLDYDLKKNKKLKKSIRKQKQQKKKNEKQLIELMQFLNVNNNTNPKLTFDEEDIQYLNLSRNSINKSLNEYLDPDSEMYKQEKTIPMSKSMDFNFYQNQQNSSFASLQQHSLNSNHLKTANDQNHLKLPGQLGYQRPKFGNSDRVTEDEEEEEGNFDEENEKTITNNDRLTSGGYRRVRRFGYDVEDGCGFPLSLQFLKEVNGKNQLVPGNCKEDTLKKVKTWPEILEQANEFAAKQLNCDGQHTNSSTSHHMHLYDELANVCPFPEMEFASVPSVLPFRRWNSELNLTIKQKNKIQKNENHFLTNQLENSNSTTNLWKSCEDLRHLTSHLNLAKEKLLPYGYDMIYSNDPFKMNKNFSCNSSDLNYTSSSNSSWRISSSSSNSSSISGVSNLIGMDMNTLINNPWEVFLQNFNPKLVAIELTKIEIDLFLHLNCTEISREIFAPNRSLNITQYFEIHCIYLFIQLILKQDQLNKRMTCLKLCIDLLGELYKLKNWQSFKSVLIALHCIPIIRLKQTWIELNSIYPAVYEEFQKLSRFNLINHDHHLLHNHNQLSIPCLTEFLNEIRARIAFKLNQVNCKPKLFSKPETITDWLNTEMTNLQNLLIMNQQMSSDSELVDKHKLKKSNIIKKLLRSFNSKKRKMKEKMAKTNELNGQQQLTNKNSSNNIKNLTNDDHLSVDLNQLKANIQLDDKEKVDDELILLKTVNSNNCLEEWREIQMDLKIKFNNFKPEIENSILNEINKCLVLHQAFVLSYKCSNTEFSDTIQSDTQTVEESKASIIRRCLLQLVKLNSNSMQELMKISLKLEN